MYLGLEEPEAVCNFAVQIVKALSSFSAKPEPSLLDGLDFWRSLNQVKKLVDSASARCVAKYSFIPAALAAFARLEACLAQRSRGHIKEKITELGLRDAVDKVAHTFGVPCPPQVVGFVSAARSCTALSEEQLASDIDHKHEALQKYLPLYIKLQGMDLDFLKEVAGPLSDKVAAFLDKFQVAMKTWLRNVETQLLEIQPLVEKYRPP